MTAGELVTDGLREFGVVVSAFRILAAFRIVSKPAEVRVLLFPSRPHDVELTTARAFHFPMLLRSSEERFVKLVSLVAGVGDVQDDGIPKCGRSVVGLLEPARFPVVDLFVDLVTDGIACDVAFGEHALHGQIAMREELRIHSELGVPLDSSTMRKYLTRGGYSECYPLDQLDTIVNKMKDVCQVYEKDLDEYKQQ